MANLLPDPEPRPRRYTIVSVDDHLIEPPDLFEGRMPKALADQAPRVVETDEGAEMWLYEGTHYPNVGLNAVVGRPQDEWSMEPARFDEMRHGCWDIHERIRDMDIGGIQASLNFPSLLAGFAGTVFSRSKDPELGLACVRAWNDWHHDVWAGTYPERIIPLQIPWLRDPVVAADEIRANAGRGFRAVSFAENPANVGLPSVHTDHWDPFLRACEETETVVCLHTGSSAWTAATSPGAPLELLTTLFPANALASVADWVWAKIPLRFPGIRVAMAEGGIGWVPMLLDRLDYVVHHSAQQGGVWDGPLLPSEALQRNFWFCTIDDPSTIELRDRGGLSGFTRRSESAYDPFGAAHSSTSISAGLGMAVARDLKGEKRNVIAVIGDGAMSAGMAYEAMNNAGAMESRLIVILNDNDMSIAPPVGGMSAYLSRLISSHSYRSLRHLAKDVVKHLPEPVRRLTKRAEEYARGLVTGGTLFEELGFYYVGPIDGHNLEHLLPVLRNIRDWDENAPVLVHVVTEKGHGYAPAEAAADKLHAVSKFDVVTGAQAKAKAGPPTYTKVFAQALMAEAAADDKVVAITAAMPSGTGLDMFGKAYPDRTFDVGIAEQHAVTFAAGLASEGFKPFAAIYSTFLQRAYDQVVHDVAIQSLPVRFALDRAGLVGADGATHAGSFDLAYLCCLPNFVVMAPSDELELMHMVATAASIDDRPSAVRYPRGEGLGLDLPARGTVLEIGRGRIVQQGTTVALISLGTRLAECMKAAELLAAKGLSTTVADARFAKPIDTDLIRKLAREHEVVITVEEGSSGGFGAMVLHDLSAAGLLDRGLKIRTLTLPDRYIDHDAPAKQYDEAGLNAPQIVKAAIDALGNERASAYA